MSLRAIMLGFITVLLLIQGLGAAIAMRGDAQLKQQHQQSAMAYDHLVAMVHLSLTAEARFRALAANLLTRGDEARVDERHQQWVEEFAHIEAVIEAQSALGIEPEATARAREGLAELRAAFADLEREITDLLRFFDAGQVDAAQDEVGSIVSRVTRERVSGLLQTAILEQGIVVDEALAASEALLATKRRIAMFEAISSMFVTIGACLWAAAWILRPVAALTRRTHAVSLGDLTTQTGAGGPTELGDLSDAFDTMVTQLAASHRRLAEEVARRSDAQDQALAANRAKSAFLANMSHELRTPLNAILGYAEMISEDTTEDETRMDLDHILVAGRHLLALVSDVLDLAKIEAGHTSIHRREVGVAHLCRDLAEGLRPAVTRNHNTLSLSIGPEVTTWRTDPDKLRQCLTNLLGNAGKFTDHGHIALTVSVTEEGLILAVSDDGVGIPEDKLGIIFDEFRQADGSSTREFKGTGLGLSITRHLMQILGGKVRVASVLGEGSTFTLVVPRIDEEDATEAPQPIPQSRDQHPSDAFGQGEQGRIGQWEHEVG